MIIVVKNGTLTRQLIILKIISVLKVDPVSSYNKMCSFFILRIRICLPFAEGHNPITSAEWISA